MTDNTKQQTFFGKYAVAIDTEEIGGFDVFGLPEVAFFSQGGMCFEVAESITISDIVESLGELPEPYSTRYIQTIADIKARKMVDAVIKLRDMVRDEFAKQMKIIADGRSPFYIPKEKIVQFVRVPVSYIDLAPGSTSINFRIFTQRFLGEKEDAVIE